MTAHRCEVVLYEDPECEMRCGKRTALYAPEWNGREDIYLCTEHATEASAAGAELLTIDPNERLS